MTMVNRLVHQGTFLPVLTVVVSLIVIWYAGAVYLNSTQLIDRYQKKGVDWDISRLAQDAWKMERPVLPAPHQVGVELKKTVIDKRVTSKRSLVYHAGITLSSSLLGFALGTLLGIGLSHFTEIVGAGPVKNCDILGLGMFDSCEIRIHPTGSAIARLGTISQGQGHATTFAQILASEIGIPAEDITLEEGDTDTAPYGLGTYGSRSTPVAGAAAAMAGRKIRAKAQMIAAYLLEVHDNDIEWDVDRFVVKGSPERFKTMKEIAFASYNQAIPGVEPGLEAVSYYDPPNMTYPFGSYICVMEIDVDTGTTEIRQVYALDDCGTRINPMIIEGQVHGGLTEALAISMGQEIAYDEQGNVTTGTLMDFFVPTAVETPKYQTDYTVTPSPHHPIGAKGVGESPNVGGVPAFSNAVHDAFRAFGLTQSHMPHDHWRIWKTAESLGLHD